MTDLRELPDGWQIVRLDDVAEVVGGSTPSRANHEYWGGNIPWVVPSELTELPGRYLTCANETITDAGLKSAGLKVIPRGSVLLTTRATIGLAAINTIPVATNQGFQSLVLRTGTDHLWLYYLMLSMRKELQRRASGSTFREISRDSVRSILIPLPPLDEQQAIAAVLAILDQAVENTRAVIAATANLHDSFMRELVQRGFNGLGSPPSRDIGRIHELLSDEGHRLPGRSPAK